MMVMAKNEQKTARLNFQEGQLLPVLWAMGLRSAKAGNLRRLSGSPRVSIVRVAKSGYLASVNGVTVT